MLFRRIIRTLTDTIVDLVHVQVLHIRRKDAIKDLASALCALIPPSQTPVERTTYGIENLLSRIQPPHVQLIYKGGDDILDRKGSWAR